MVMTLERLVALFRTLYWAPDKIRHDAHEPSRKDPALWLGTGFSHPDLHYNGIAMDVIVEPEDKLRWMVDGDLYSTEKPLHLSVGPTITVVSP